MKLKSELDDGFNGFFSYLEEVALFIIIPLVVVPSFEITPPELAVLVAAVTLQ